MGLLDGKVVLITGAGRGIGRAHALACAREGASIVVNDLGGARDGSGGGESVAEQVVAEIKALGSDAVANHDSVTDPAGCERMVGAALAKWNRLDVVINNAGILRDKTFVKMTDDEWKIVVSVHLDGTRNVTKAALVPLMEHGGSIINTTSYSGLIGNFGQSNYAAAKAGIFGLTRVLSMELRKAGIRVNAIAPVAKTRMTEEIAMVPDDFKPEQISPVAVFLASDLAKDVTGRVFGVQGQRIHVYEMKTNDGIEKPGSEPWTAQEIAEKLGGITAFEVAAPAAAPSGDDLVTVAFSFLPSGFKPGAAAGWKAIIQWKVAGGTDQTVLVDGDRAEVRAGLHGTPTCTVKVDKDTLIGMLTGTVDSQKAFMSGKAAADNMGDLIKMATAFDFKKAAAAFQAAKGGAPAPKEPAKEPAKEAAPAAAAEKPMPIGKRYDGGFFLVDRAQAEAYAAATDDANDAYRGPSAVAPPMYHTKPFIGLMIKMATDPDLKLDMLRLVHAEHDMRFHRPLRHGDVVQLRGVLQSYEEKSSGKLVRFGLIGFVDGQAALEGMTSYFIRGAKKDEAKKPEPAPAPPPDPDLVIPEVVADDQASRYAKASGDGNPIHTDPAVAKAAGLPGVILHGLCTMAFAQRDLVNRLAGGDPTRLKRLSVRFAKPVFPGQTLTLKVWGKKGEVRFTTENADGQVVIANGLAEIA